MEKKHCNILLILLNGVIASMYQVLKDSSEEDVTLQGSNNSNQIILGTRHKKKQFGRDKDLSLKSQASYNIRVINWLKQLTGAH
jgi:hypothetical protein